MKHTLGISQHGGELRGGKMGDIDERGRRGHFAEMVTRLAVAPAREQNHDGQSEPFLDDIDWIHQV